MLLQLARVIKCILAGNEYMTYVCTIIQQPKSVEKGLCFLNALGFKEGNEASAAFHREAT